MQTFHQLLFFFCGFLLAAVPLLAQPTQDASTQDASTQDASTQDAPWLTRLDEARQQAEATQTPILMVFSGSDWCRPCIELKKVLFDSKTFQQYAAQHLTLLELDFPMRKANQLSQEQQQHNNELAARFNEQGIFPLVVLLNAQEEPLGTFGFVPGQEPEAYLSAIQEMLQEG